MSLHECRKSQRIAHRNVILYLLLRQDRADEQNSLSAEKLCLIYHVFVHREVLAYARYRHILSYLAQVIIAAEKPLRLGQNRNAVRACRLIVLCDLLVRKLLRYHAL